MIDIQEWIQRQRARLDEAAGDWLSQVDLDRSLGSVDDVVTTVADRIVPPGEAAPAPDLRPGWASEPGRAYVAQAADDASLDRLDVAAFYAGEALIAAGGADAAMTWAAGDSRFANAGNIVVTDGRGAETDLVFLTVRSVHAHLSGEAAHPLSEVLAALADQSLTTPEAAWRERLPKAYPRVKLRLRPPAAGLLRRRPTVPREVAERLGRGLAEGWGGGRPAADVPADPGDWVVHLDPGEGWWTAALHAVPRKAGGSTGRELDAVDITVVGSPEDHAIGSDDAQLKRFLGTVRHLAAEHGLDVEDVTEQQRRAWRSRGHRG